MIESMVNLVMRGFEVAGISVIVLGTVWATAVFCSGIYAKREFEKVYYQYRANVGRTILLGLEFLVAADIVGTVAIEPSFRNLGILALIVAVRTFLSFALDVEINGRWPWQSREKRRSASGEARNLKE